MSAILPTVDLVTNPQAMGYDGYIDNILIRLAVSPESVLEDATAEAAAPRIDTTENAEDVRDEVGQRYSRSDFSGGAGLDFMHSPAKPADASTRFWDSKGVDVFATDRGDIYDVRLMNSVEQTLLASDLIDVCQIDGTVYYARTDGIYEYGVGAIRSTHSGLVKLTAMGNSLYTLDGTNGVMRYDPPSWAPTSISSIVYDDMWTVKSRVVGVLDNVLYDTTDDSVLLTLPVADRVTAVVESGPALLVFATTGSVYSLAIDQALSLVSAGESKFGDEIPVMAVETFGLLGIVTAEATEAGGRVARFYTAALSLTGSYDLADLQLIYQVGDRDTTQDLTPHAMLGVRDSIYTAIPEAGTTEITLWRYYLPTGGYARAHTIDPGTIETVASFVEVDDRMFVGFSGDDLFRESDDFIPEGYVIGPVADFATADKKQWVGSELSGVPLPQGTTLELYDTTDPDLINDPTSSSWQLVLKLTTTQSSASIASLSGRDDRYHAAKVIMRSDSSRGTSSAFRSYSFRALPAPKRDLLLRIPINVSDQIESRGRRAMRIPGRGKAIEKALRLYEGKQVLVELYRPEFQMRGLIERFEAISEIISPQGAVRHVMYCRIRGTRLEDLEVVTTQTSGASLGQDTAGLFIAGVGVDTP